MSDQSDLPPAPTLGDQLGLGPQWAPAPAAWGVAPLTAADGSKVYVLLLHTAGGSMGAAFTAEGIRALVAGLTEQVSGLTIATTIPVANGTLRPKGHG